MGWHTESARPLFNKNIARTKWPGGVRSKRIPTGRNGNGANLGFEADLFLAADKLRKYLEPSDYKHVVLGLIFLRHISHSFEAKREALLAEDAGAAEEQDEYLADNVFWVPKEARWTHLQASAKEPGRPAGRGAWRWAVAGRDPPIRR